ncbi:hypothetical protein BBP40_005095 [Aspergillus hancockii]|nr:hypothetical protein BBP40_005095 [Aspergillus hancockii]
MSTAQHQSEPASLNLHAELLPNIRHITLHISLPTTVRLDDTQPEIHLSDSRRAISVFLPPPSDHVADTIKLPARVNEASRRALSMAGQKAGDAGSQKRGQREYSFRMQIDDGDSSLFSREEHMDSFVPWTATDMTTCTRLCCRHCQNTFLDSSAPYDSSTGKENLKGWVWKDLPSGNWAEMMDFWHCHKPEPHEYHDHDTNDATARLPEDQNATVKGYGAANQVVATPGTILVDVATFLVADTDCRGLKQVAEKSIVDSSIDLEPELHCEICNSHIGVEDTVAKGWRLFKTSLSVSKLLSEDESEDPSWETHPLETVVAAQLLELVERESARRFVLHCGQGDGLLIWVFNPDMQYSNSSSDHNITAQRALKIFFQDVADVDAMLHPELGKTSSLSLDELRVPSNVFSAVSETLKSRNKMLPDSAREFREWKVGIMHRFDRTKNV